MLQTSLRLSLSLFLQPFRAYLYIKAKTMKTFASLIVLYLTF